MTASETIHLLELSKYENDCKRFSSISAGVLLEKVIRKNYEMFWHKTSMRKPFFSKATYAVQPEKNFSIHFFLENFEKCPEKKHKNFQKND